MKNIHLIPKDKLSRLAIEDKELILVENIGNYRNAQHIYITSNEVLPYDSSVFDNGAFYHRDAAGDVHIITKHTFKPNPRFCKRIILTTDQDLIADGVQAIDDEFLEWFVKNLSCEEVEVKKYHGINTSIAEINAISGDGSLNWQGINDLRDYKIIIPKEEPKTLTKLEIARNIASIGIGKKEEPKQETLEESAARHFNKEDLVEGVNIQYVLQCAFVQGAKWQQERMYSEEEVLDILQEFKRYLSFGDEISQLEWFEQFKKK